METGCAYNTAKRTMKKFTYLLFCSIILMVTSCSEEEILPIMVESVTISPSTDLELTIGESKVLTASVQPTNAVDKTISWTSSDMRIAAVENGTVLAVSQGETKITAKAINGISAYVTVIVNAGEEPEPEPVEGITFADPAFKAALLNPQLPDDWSDSYKAKFVIDTNNDGEISMEEAATATHIYVAEVEETRSRTKNASNEISLDTHIDVVNPDKELCNGKGVRFNDKTSVYTTKTGNVRDKIKSMSEIEYFTALEYLHCSTNTLTTLNVSKNTALETLYCYDNQLTSLDVSKNTALKKFGCSGNSLTTLDVSKNIALDWFNCGDNSLSTLDISKNTMLESLYCYENRFTSLDISRNIALELLSCFFNQLTVLNISKNAALEQLWCYGNKLTTLDVSLLLNLEKESLFCGNQNDSKTITVTMTKEQNRLPVLDTESSKNSHITVKVIGEDSEGSDNDFIKFEDPTFKAVLIALTGYSEIDTNNDGEISYKEASIITDLSVPSKNIKSMNEIRYFTALETLSCYDNQLTSIDVSKSTKLEMLLCSLNKLTKLDVSNNRYLEDLSCTSNNLTSLDVSNNKLLSDLSCASNKLTVLKLSGATALETLSCYDNKLTTLDVSKNTRLENISCSLNQLAALDVSALSMLGKEDLTCGWQETYSGKERTLTVTMTSAQKNLPVLATYSNNNVVIKIK